ncbi:hypothetical protein HA402_007118 [Bradysia odoriphaga]|nr:hypothetical protein HA402_007118 [Bradysia odoriphaga]
MRLLKLLTLFAILVLISQCSAAQKANDDKVIVSLYYETLCPDCIEFISKQISRAWKLMGSYFDIEFVPYGNAKTLPTSPPTFQCQHGKSECEGNKMHACAIKYIPETTITQFIICSMSSKDPPNAGQKCAQLLNVDYTPIQSCVATTGEGDQLLYDYGVQTSNLEPPHQYVPWILFNGNFDEHDNNKADKDLVRVICTKLQNAPDVCNSVDLID